MLAHDSIDLVPRRPRRRHAAWSSPPAPASSRSASAATRVARVDGWGNIMGDAGSGYWIGREALDAVMRAYDGRGPQTALTDVVRAAVAGSRERLHRAAGRRGPGARRGRLVRAAASPSWRPHATPSRPRICLRAARELAIDASTAALPASRRPTTTAGRLRDRRRLPLDRSSASASPSCCASECPAVRCAATAPASTARSRWRIWPAARARCVRSAARAERMTGAARCCSAATTTPSSGPRTSGAKTSR